MKKTKKQFDRELNLGPNEPFRLAAETTTDGQAITHAAAQLERARAESEAKQTILFPSNGESTRPRVPSEAPPPQTSSPHPDYCPTCAMFTSQCQCWDPVNQIN